MEILEQRRQASLIERLFVLQAVDGRAGLKPQAEVFLENEWIRKGENTIRSGNGARQPGWRPVEEAFESPRLRRFRRESARLIAALHELRGPRDLPEKHKLLATAIPMMREVEVSANFDLFSSLPVYLYGGAPYHVINNQRFCDSAVRQLRSEKLLGFDIESKQFFKKDRHNIYRWWRDNFGIPRHHYIVLATVFRILSESVFC